MLYAPNVKTHKLPKHLLWDVDIEGFDPSLYQEFLAERIAEKGDTQSLNWYFENFGFIKFIEVISSSRQVSDQTKSFWKKFIQHNQNIAHVKKAKELIKTKMACRNTDKTSNYFTEKPLGQS